MIKQGVERKSKHPGLSLRVHNIGSGSGGEREELQEQRAMGHCKRAGTSCLKARAPCLLLRPSFLPAGVL